MIYFCRLSCASWIPRLRKYGSEFGWAMCFELGFSDGIAMGAPVGSPLGYSIKMFLGLELCYQFFTWEVYLVEVSLGRLSGSMIGTGEGYLVGLSLVLPLRSSLEPLNPGAQLPGTLLVAPSGLWFGYEVRRCMCSCLRLLDFHEANFWEVRISCVSLSGDFITSKNKSVRYCQLMQLLTLSLSPTQLIPTYGGRSRAAELDSTGSILFTLGMDEDSYRLTADLSG